MAGDYRFPNWPCIPDKPAVFDDRSLVRPRRDCPWAWTATALMVFAILMTATRGVLW